MKDVKPLFPGPEHWVRWRYDQVKLMLVDVGTLALSNLTELFRIPAAFLSGTSGDILEGALLRSLRATNIALEPMH
ncbi:hypothetical protein N7533_007718 [Penicillium manginii]|uniref:uncharacterized protein n=1 Tax=Penicillium manginii TaxID=203109 RepID=UPI0025468394|nr:uncharacterized protein N7533_007718 [Penicillium manginii]KAJ5750690.1 hypothetical protein N7533_007718 [Penicillium manginii]